MDSLILVIFGITGNLAQIKLIPALYDMSAKGLLPADMKIIGVARRKYSTDDIKNHLHEALHQQNRHHQHEIKDEIFNKLAQKIHYIDGVVDDPNLYQKIKDLLASLIHNDSRNIIFYLATYPSLYAAIFHNLQKNDMSKQSKGFVRLMIEKPIGNDLKSAQDLNKLLLKYFSEDQIYRLDHYLGKETLQNILTFRFGNELFEPLINKDSVDHIQVSALEDFGIGGRGGYYDSVGALKDVGQNHLLQMLAFATMDAPSQFSNEAVTKERVKILSNLIPYPTHLVLGQYQGYTKEENIAKDSRTDTYFAFKCEIDNQRFKGVPVFVRGGKKLTQTVAEIAIVFKTAITSYNRLFKHLEGGEEPNVLIYRIQPNEGIGLTILTKRVGHENKLESSLMQFCYNSNSSLHFIPDPYERLLSDAIRGDQTFFNDAKEIEAQWRFIDPLAKKQNNLAIYKPGTWGPKDADLLIKREGRFWLVPNMDF